MKKKTAEIRHTQRFTEYYKDGKLYFPDSTEKLLFAIYGETAGITTEHLDYDELIEIITYRTEKELSEKVREIQEEYRQWEGDNVEYFHAVKTKDGLSDNVSSLRTDIVRALAGLLPQPGAPPAGDITQEANPTDAYTDTSKETIELFSREGNYDTPKKTNRSEYVATQELIDEIEGGGVTLERLDELQKTLPVFKYRTQITIHGNFDKIENLRVGVGRYKSLILNQNGTLGVRYVAIDAWKKVSIEKALNFSSHLDGWEKKWRFLHDSRGTQLRYTIGTATEKQAFLELVNKGKKLLADVPQELFVGSTNLVKAQLWGAVSVLIVIDIQAIPEKYLWKFIGYLTNGLITEVIYNQLEQEEEAKAEAARIEQKEQWARISEKRQQNRELMKRQRAVIAAKYKLLQFTPEKNKGSLLLAEYNVDDYEPYWTLYYLHKRDGTIYWNTVNISPDKITDGFTPEHIEKSKTYTSTFKKPSKFPKVAEHIEKSRKKGLMYVVDDSDYNQTAASAAPTRTGKPAPTESKRGDTPQIVRYSDKSHAVIGNTYNYRDVIKNAGGTFNKFLKIDGKTVAGWIVPSSKIHLLDFTGLSDGLAGVTSLRTDIVRALATAYREDHAPWLLTLAEWRALRPGRTARQQELAHRQIVLDALQSGKPVPQRILEDYEAEEVGAARQVYKDKQKSMPFMSERALRATLQEFFTPEQLELLAELAGKADNYTEFLSGNPEFAKTFDLRMLWYRITNDKAVFFHGTNSKNTQELQRCIRENCVRITKDGMFGDGFYLAPEVASAAYEGQLEAIPDKNSRSGWNGRGFNPETIPDVVAIDVRNLKIMKKSWGKSQYYDYIENKFPNEEDQQNAYNNFLKRKGYDGLYVAGRGELVIWNIEKMKEAFSLREVYEFLKKTP